MRWVPASSKVVRVDFIVVRFGQRFRGDERVIWGNLGEEHSRKVKQLEPRP